jgi:hypothetical protein
MNAAQKDKWTDILTRSFMAAELILDTKPGMLDMIAGQVDKKIDFSGEIVESARKLKTNK